MIEEDIIAEIRAARDAHAQKFNYDIDAMFRDWKEKEKTCGHPVVSLPPKRIPPTKKPSKPDEDAA